LRLLDRAAAAAWWPREARQRRTLGLLLAAGLLLRVVWVAYAAREPTLFNSGDPWAYLLHGREIAAGRGYHVVGSTVPTAFYPIGYPLYIALFAWPVQHGLLPDDVTRLVGFSQAVLGTATALFVWVVANRAVGARAAIIAAALVAFWPGLILLGASLSLETVFVALMMASLAVLAARPASDALPTTRRLLVAGLLLGLSALVRPFSIVVLGAVFVAVVVVRPPRPVVTALRITLTLAVPVVLVLAPAMIRNQRAVGTIALSTNMGETFCLDHHVGATGRFAYPEECFTGFDDVAPEDLERVRNDEDFRRGLRFIRDHPSTEIGLVFDRLWYTHEGDHDGVLQVEASGRTPFLPSALRTTLDGIADWWYRAALLAALAGAVLALRPSHGRQLDRTTMLLTAFALTLVPLELYGYTRFHIPVIPFQAILAAVTLAWLHERGASRRPAPSSARDTAARAHGTADLRT
jgi:hypothetical protein